jgi:prepilin-type N-terminal cleavage/methylation domain-containing protein
MRNGFTLVEVLIVIVIIGSVLAFSVIGTRKFRDSLEYGGSVNQILSDIKLTRQLADASSQTCRIEFKAGGNVYTISKGGRLFRTITAGGGIRFGGKSFFSFVPAGYTDIGGSGTLLVGGVPKARKIIVSSRGRIRIE